MRAGKPVVGVPPAAQRRGGEPDNRHSWYVLAEKDQAVPEESRGGPINYSEVGSGG
jgi:hypothetical protein